MQRGDRSQPSAPSEGVHCSSCAQCIGTPCAYRSRALGLLGAGTRDGQVDWPRRNWPCSRGCARTGFLMPTGPCSPTMRLSFAFSVAARQEPFTACLGLGPTRAPPRHVDARPGNAWSHWRREKLTRPTGPRVTMARRYQRSPTPPPSCPPRLASTFQPTLIPSPSGTARALSLSCEVALRL